MPGARTSLEAELQDELPPSFRSLEEADLQRLTTLLRDARREQRAALQDALDAAFGFVPRVLRGPIKRILGS